MLGAEGIFADITDETTIQEAFAHLPRIDILINNAGIDRLTPLDDTTPANADIFRRILAVNVTGTYLVTRAAIPKIPHGGRIINTSSVWGRVGEPLFGAYVASKHALIGLTKAWAKELGPRGINVNGVAPGWVETESSLRSLKLMAQRCGLEETVLLDKILAGQALPGLMQPEDIAGAYMFLASPHAANVTSQTLSADRGEAPC